MDLSDYKTKDGISVVDLLGKQLQVDNPAGENSEPPRVDLDSAQILVTISPPAVKVNGLVMPADGKKTSGNGRSAGKFGTFDVAQVYVSPE